MIKGLGDERAVSFPARGDGVASAITPQQARVHAREGADRNDAALLKPAAGSEPADSQPRVDPSPPQEIHEELESRMVTKAAPIDSLTASTDEAEPLHTSDDERLDMMTNIITALEGMIEDPDPDITIESILEDCRALDVLIVATVQRELAARVDPSPLALLDALLGQLASEQMQHLEAADRYDRAGDTAGNAHAELKAARICREHFEAVMTLRAALLAPTPSK